jgi:ribonuclease HI
VTSGGWIAYCDGASRGNPGPASYGVVVVSPDGKTTRELGVALGKATNQVAEYEALIRALRELADLGARRAVIYTDSQFVARQFSGEYRVKDPRMAALRGRVAVLEKGFDSLTVTHIPRSSRPGNVRADQLANQALDALKG